MYVYIYIHIYIYMYQNFVFVFGEPVESKISEILDLTEYIPFFFYFKINSKAILKSGHLQTVPLSHFQQDN